MTTRKPNGTESVVSLSAKYRGLRKKGKLTDLELEFLKALERSLHSKGYFSIPKVKIRPLYLDQE